MRRLAFLSALLAVLACDPMPPRPEGTFVLVSQGSAAIPGIVYADSLSSYTILADTVEIWLGGKGRRVIVSRFDWFGGTPVSHGTRIVREFELFESGNRWRARDLVGCVQSSPTLDEIEDCSSLWNQEVEFDGEYLHLASRRYRRALKLPSRVVPAF